MTMTTNPATGKKWDDGIAQEREPCLDYGDIQMGEG